MTKQVVQLDRVIIRFAGDSGDGMQLTGDRFTSETAAFGNDLSTLPDFPAEIRAPAGTLPGVSAFQLHFADHDIMTPGDAPNVLVAMNPAALKANLKDLPRGADIIVNTDEFTTRNLTKVGYAASPLDDGSLDAYNVHPIGLTSMTVGALEEFDISKKDAERAKNMFALGLLSWLYNRPTEGTVKFLEAKFAKKPEIMRANVTAFQAGWSFGETTEDFSVSYEIKPAAMPAGRYRNITGNLALSYGLVAAAQRSALPLFLGAYPITPASDILHELSKHKRFGIRTFQAEDEIAGIGAALGRQLRRRARRDHDLRSRDRAQGRDDRAGGVAGAAAGRRRRAARRPVDRAADQDRAVRPAAGDVRPQRRGAGADRGAAFARRLLRRRARGRPDRAEVPHAGVPALRRLPGQRLRAVADPGHRGPARPAGRVRDHDQPHPRRRQRGVLAVPARPGDAGPAVGGAGHGRSRAPHRRHREGRRVGQHLLRPDQPRPHGPHPAGQGRRHRARHRAARGGRPERRGPGARARLGLDVRPDRGGLSTGAQRAGWRWRRLTCGT